MVAKKKGVVDEAIAVGETVVPVVKQEPTTALAVVEQNYPALVGSRLKEVGEVLKMNLGAKQASWTDLERIKVPSGEIPMYMVEDPVHGVSTLETFEAICVWFRDCRVWWPKSIKEGGSGGGGPTCESRDLVQGNGNNGGTDGEAIHACETCPNNRWGKMPAIDPESDAAQDHNWCSQRMMMFLLRRERERSIFPSVLIIPPTSIKKVGAYFMGLGGDGIPFFGMTTKFGLLQTQNKKLVTYSVVTVEPGDELLPAEREKVAEYRKAIEPSFEALQIIQD